MKEYKKQATSFDFTSIVMLAGLQGPWNIRGCNKNVLPFGMKRVGVPIAPHTSFHASRNACKSYRFILIYIKS